MWVTCYADASFSHHQGGAWGVWLRCDRGRLRRHGMCPSYVTSSVQAELAAIFAGIHLALKTWGADVEGINVRSDCQGALVWLEAERAPAKSKPLRRLQQKIHEAVAAHGVQLIGRWVKGHQRSGSTEAYLNNHCDSMARRRRKTSSKGRKKRKKKKKVKKA